VLPKNNLAGKARAKRPGYDLNRGDSIVNENARYLKESIKSIRDRSDVTEVIKLLLREEGMFSSAGNSMVSIGANSGFRIAGFDSAGVMDIDVMALGYLLMDRLDTIHDYSTGYNDKPASNSLINMLLLDTVTSGGCGVEVVLRDDFTPDRLVPVAYSSIEWQADGKGGRYPTQENGDIVLNLPTVFIAEHGRQPSEPYSASPLRPGLNNTMYFTEFLEDTRRAVNRTGHSRMTTTINAEKLAASAPQSIRNDDEKMQKYMKDQYDSVQAAIEALEPEDAVIAFDSVEFKVHDTGGTKSDYSPMLNVLGNLQGASLKTPASVTGLRANGGQGLSNSETLVYLKTVESMRIAAAEVLSRALTLSVRLLGIDGFIKFDFQPINLRPQDELEAYKGTKQKRIFEGLSYGFINDAQACWELGVRPQGLQESLAGSRFYTNEKTHGGEAERSSSSGAALNPGTPSKSGGDDQ
jgi:hypothetical protein